MKSVSYSWSSCTYADGTVSIRETRTMNGIEEHKEFDPMPAKLADSFVKARREAISRLMSREGNIRLFLH